MGFKRMSEKPVRVGEAIKTHRKKFLRIPNLQLSFFYAIVLLRSWS